MASLLTSTIFIYATVCFLTKSEIASCFTINSVSLEAVEEGASVATTTEEEEEYDMSDIYLKYQNYLSCQHPGISYINQYHIRWIHNGTVLVDTNDTSIRLPKNMKFFEDYTLKVNKFMRDKEYYEYTCEITGPKDPEYQKELELLFAELESETYAWNGDDSYASDNETYAFSNETYTLNNETYVLNNETFTFNSETYATDNETYADFADLFIRKKRDIWNVNDKIDSYPEEYDKMYRTCWLIAARISEDELESPLAIGNGFRERMRNCMEENVDVYWSDDAVETDDTLREKRHIKLSEEWLPGIIETQHSVEKKSSLIRCRLPSSDTNATEKKVNHYRWLRNGELIWDFKNPLVRSSAYMEPIDRDTLEIDYDQLIADHNVSYSCQFLNTVQKVSTTISTFTNKKLILQKIPNSGKVEVELMQEVILQCITKNVAKTSIEWYFKEKKLNVSSSKNLKLNVTSKDYAGDYKCVVSNACYENEEFATFSVNVLYKPEITMEKNFVHTTLGGKTELSCNVFAYPAAKVDWLHNGQLLNTSSRMHQRIFKEKHTLVIRDVQIIDFGQYTCQATNFLGRVTRFITLTGIANKGKFKTEKERRSHTAYTLIWEVDSSPPIIQYRLLFRKYKKKNNANRWIQLIVPSTDNSGPIHTEVYTLTGLEPSTVYEATVSSRNYFGWSEPSSVHKFATENLDVVDDEVEQPTEVYSKVISATPTFSDFSFVTNEIESALEQKGTSINLSVARPLLFVTLIFAIFVNQNG